MWALVLGRCRLRLDLASISYGGNSMVVSLFMLGIVLDR